MVTSGPKGHSCEKTRLANVGTWVKVPSHELLLGMPSMNWNMQNKELNNKVFLEKSFSITNANLGWTGTNCAKETWGHSCFIFSSSKNYTAALSVCMNNILSVCFEGSSVLPSLKFSMNGGLQQEFFPQYLGVPETLNLILQIQCIGTEASFLKFLFFL